MELSIIHRCDKAEWEKTSTVGLSLNLSFLEQKKLEMTACEKSGAVPLYTDVTNARDDGIINKTGYFFLKRVGLLLK